jgi:hypothetical protein
MPAGKFNQLQMTSLVLSQPAVETETEGNIRRKRVSSICHRLALSIARHILPN